MNELVWCTQTIAEDGKTVEQKNDGKNQCVERKNEGDRSFKLLSLLSAQTV